MTQTATAPGSPTALPTAPEPAERTAEPVGRALRALVERARTLDERLGAEPAGAADPAGDAPPAWSEWCRLVGKGNEPVLLKRLRWDGVDTAHARRALDDAAPGAAAPVPGWAATLRACIAAMDGAPPADTRADAEAAPFGDLLAPLADLGTSRLSADAPGGLRLLSDDARAALRRELLRFLSRVAAPVLHPRFSAHRARGGFRPADADPASTRLYDGFIAGVRAEGALALFHEHPVLGRLLATTVDQWVEGRAEFLHRLSRDADAIRRELPGAGAALEVARLRSGISDPHRGGRSALTLTLAGGARLVYKPRSVGMEEAFSALLQWLGAEGAPVELRALRVLDRGAYGWMEFAESAPCASAEEAREYYRRAGALLGLVHVLGGSDFHLENVVAAGPHPVLVDLETVMQPVLRSRYAWGERARAEAFQALYGGSVLGTGLLPVWQASPGGSCFDPSGFTTPEGQEPFGTTRRWAGTGTDAMETRTEATEVQPRHSAPSLEGAAVSPGTHQDALLDGFRRTCAFLAERREAVAAGPLRGFRDRPVRFIFRSSATYDRILQQSLQPACMALGVRRSVELDLTARAFLSAAEPPPLWPLLRDERRALERMDIPFFTLPSTGTVLPLETGEVAGAFTQSAWDRAAGRLHALSAAEVRRQEHLIRTSLALRYPAAPAAAPRTPPLPAPDDLLGWAVELGEAVRGSALRVDGLGAVWGVPRPVGRGARLALQPAGHGLFHGQCGVALFLAALARAAGCDASRRDALEALRPLREHVLPHPASVRALLAEAGPGAADGAGSIVYALVRLAALLDEPALLDEARRLAEVLSVAPATTADVGTGAAGAVLGLLALYRATGDAQALRRAERAAAPLLGWRGAAPPAPAGPDRGTVLMLHGPPGIAYALMQLHAAGGDGPFAKAARRAAAFTPRPDADAAGGTLGELPALDDLLGGTLGKADSLLQAGRDLSRPEMAGTARAMAVHAARRAARSGGFRLRGLPPGGPVHAGFLTGVSGIGYVLLRLRDPERLPSVMLWR